jgi:trimethylguanosine synthase
MSTVDKSNGDHQADAGNEKDLGTTKEMLIIDSNPNDASMVTDLNTKNHSKKRKKKKRKRVSNSSSNKRRKTAEKYWIEDCSDSVLPPEYQNAWASSSGPSHQPVPVLELLITRSTLTDDYRHPPVPSNQDQAESIGDKVVKEFGEPNYDAATDTKSNPDGKTVQDSPADSNYKTNEPTVEEVSRDGSSLFPFEAPKPEYSTYHKHKVDLDHQAFICVKRANSAKQPMVWDHDRSIERFQPLPNGDCGDGVLNPYPKHVVGDKYWSQRRRLFTRFDEGIQLDPESWFSVTPEAIANHIAAHLVGNRRVDVDSEENNKKMIVLDPFGGCGGNSIAFARRDEVELVISVDVDQEKLKMAAANAAIYGVPKHKLVFVHDNGCRVMSCFGNGELKASQDENEQINTSSGYRIGGLELLPSRVDCIFLSPPWGGVEYGKCGKRNYALEHIRVDGLGDDEDNIDGERILKYAANCVGRNGPIAYFLPKNTNGIEFGKSVLKAGCMEGPVVMEQNVLNGKLKTVTAYVGL